ncbi:frataxin, mitochondrial [Euwallacea similis]|uniref:frataxin, mitochondrial n=1 Tax=Euwallacea similis TaxID=1736056 RepID=UPI0034507172
MPLCFSKLLIMLLKKCQNLLKILGVSLSRARNLKIHRTCSSHARRIKQKSNNILHRSPHSICSNHNLLPYLQCYSVAIKFDLVDSNTFERVCEETLNTLAEYFDELVVTEPKFEKADVVYGGGVLTIDLGNYGTYVINRQSPNRQIWLSSPTSGPKRFDYSAKENLWIYKHDGQTLKGLLKNEFEQILGKQIEIPVK